MKNRYLLIVSLVLIVIGIVGLIYAASYTYIDSAGILHDLAWLPLGSLLVALGVVLLLALGLLSGVEYFRSRL